MTDAQSRTAPTTPGGCPTDRFGPGGTLVLLRHGETEWNRAGRLTGWVDQPLNPTGRAQAEAAGRALAATGLRPDLVLCSALGRAVETARIVGQAAGFDLAGEALPQDWRLNERHYGVLQGHTRDSAAAAFGARLARSWRREVDARPPSADASAEPTAVVGPVRHSSGEIRGRRAESLQDVETRVLACWHETLSSTLVGRTVLIVSHTNPIRALTGHLEALPQEQIWHRQVPSATPLVLRLGVTRCQSAGQTEVLLPAGPRPGASE